ncbi:hypothetical protein [Rickettsia endosymbiont of Polydrusus tereticollis]|uniref:hypothetical protein n=1 Tax=Rickettsia endosymbiont of Polydrusus tereticollis TaxID=3066251 RepID=UPI003132A200
MTKIKNLKKNTIDDLEIENQKKISKLKATIVEKRSKDNLDLPSRKNLPLKKLQTSNFENTSPGKKSKISQIFAKIKSKWEFFKNSKVGKILFSNSFNYALSLGGATIALTGIFTPISPLIIAVASIAAIGVGIKAVNETLKIHSLRKLHKENNLLVQNRNAKTTQDYVLSLEDGLKNALKNELYIPQQIEQKNPNKNKYNINSKKLSSTGRVLADNIGGAAYITAGIIEGASGNVIAILKATGYGVITSVSLITDGLSEKERNDVQKIFKLNINEELKKQDTPNYKNLTQLEEFTKKQTMQTLALKKLITDKNYWRMKDADKQEKFREIKKEFEEEINKDGLKAFLTKKEQYIDNREESYVKDFTKGLNPFYERPTKAQEYTNLTKAMEANPKFFEDTKDILNKQNRNSKKEVIDLTKTLKTNQNDILNKQKEKEKNKRLRMRG